MDSGFQITLKSSLAPSVDRSFPKEIPDWPPGSVIKGVVLKAVSLDTYVINAEGKQIIAQSTHLLSLGQEITMEVQGTKEGQVFARLISENSGYGETIASQILRQAGIVDTPQNQIILKVLTSFYLDLTQSNFQQVARGMTMLGNQDFQSAQLIAFAIKAHLPIQLDVLNLLQNAFRSEDLFQELKPLLAESVQVTAPKGEIPPSLRQLDGFLHQITLKHDDNAWTLAQKLRAVVNAQLPGIGSPEVLEQQGIQGAKVSGLMNSEPFIAPQQSKMAALPLTAPRQAASNGLTISSLFSPEMNGARHSSFSALADPGVEAGRSEARPERSLKPVLEPGSNISARQNLQIPNSEGMGGNILEPRLNQVGATFRNLEGTSGGPHAGVQGNWQFVDQKIEPIGAIAAAFGSSTEQSPVLKAVAGQEEYREIARPESVQKSEGTTTIPANGLEAKNMGKSFGALIVQVVNELEQILAKGNTEVADVVAKGAALEQHLASQQVLQGVDKGIQRQSDFLFFNIPYQLPDGKNTSGQLRIYKEGKNCKIDPKNARIALVLDTAHIGPITFELAIQNRDITGKVTVNDEFVAQEGRLAWPELQKALANYGFCMLKADWQIGEPLDIKPSLISEGAELKRGWIDIRI